MEGSEDAYVGYMTIKVGTELTFPFIFQTNKRIAAY